LVLVVLVGRIRSANSVGDELTASSANPSQHCGHEEHSLGVEQHDHRMELVCVLVWRA
jgi:hypothetical protein